jgi:hypothetical protein
MELPRWVSKILVALLVVVAGFLGTACPGDADAGGGGGGNGGGDGNGGGYMPAGGARTEGPGATYRFV